MKNKVPLFALCLAFGFASNIAAAKESKTEFDLEAYAGRSYDSNVSLDELDINTRIGDHATNSGLKFGFGTKLSKTLSGSIRYSLSNLSYDTFSAFDIRTGLASATLAYTLPNKSKLGLGVYRASSDLDGQDYLQLNKFNPSYSWFASKSNFIRVNLGHSEKEFSGRPLRDSTNSAIGADWFHFINGTKNFVSFGYNLKKEDAVDSIYNYDSHNLKISWTKKISLSGKKSKLKTGIKVEKRAYDSTTSGGDVERNDDRLKFFSEYEIQILPKGYLNFEYEYSDFQSNIDAQTYSQSIAKITLGLKI